MAAEALPTGPDSEVRRTVRALSWLRRDHLEKPCHPAFLPNYIRLARGTLQSVRTCLEQDGVSTPVRQRAERVLQLWEPRLQSYIESAVLTIRADVLRHAAVHLSGEEADTFLAEREQWLQELKAELEACIAA